MKFDIEKVVAEVNEAYQLRMFSAGTQRQEIDRESPLYKSLLKVNQPDRDRHEYDEELYEQRERNRITREYIRERTRPL